MKIALQSLGVWQRPWWPDLLYCESCSREFGDGGETIKAGVWAGSIVSGAC